MKNLFLLIIVSVLTLTIVSSCKSSDKDIVSKVNSTKSIAQSQNPSSAADVTLQNNSSDKNSSIMVNSSSTSNTSIAAIGPLKYTSSQLSFTPTEDTDVILNNPDMGWMVYDNYCVSRNESTIPNSAGEMKDYLFPGVSYIAIMFTWADIEKSEGEYDWTDADRAYDYWKSKGKKVMLRMSTESLLWYGSFAKGIPDYLYDRIPANQKQVLTTMQGDPAQQYTYRGVDFRNADYQNRLKAFLKNVNSHYDSTRPVEYIDLAGYGLWGEWHSGYIYPGEIKGNNGPGELTSKRDGLKAVIDIWSAAFPNNWLSLSYSYDPDSPSSFYRNIDMLSDYERWSAFDYALTKSNITWRRNGAGGAVQPTDWVFCDKAFSISKGPLAVEAAQGYNSSTVSQLVDEELNLHPNYVNIPGWGYKDARKFIEEKPDLLKKGLLKMGYRFVPTTVSIPDTISHGRNMELSVAFINKAVGKAAKDYTLRVVLSDNTGKQVSEFNLSKVPTASYIKAQTYNTVKVNGTVPDSVKPGKYKLTITLYDTERKVYVGMAVNGNGAPTETGGVCVGEVKVL
jgi:hypothetical protein